MQQPIQTQLFPSEHDQCVLEMLAHFQQQLQEASTAQEKQAIRWAMESWASTLGPPAPSRAKAKAGHHAATPERHG